MLCPNCGYSEWKAASLIYNEGKQIGIGGGIGVSRGGIGGGIGLGTGISELASLASPPIESNRSGCLVLVAFIATAIVWFVWPKFLLDFIRLFLIWTLLLAYVLKKKDRNKYESAMARWKITRICTRCGQFYLPLSASIRK